MTMTCRIIVMLTLRLGYILKKDTIDSPDMSLSKSRLMSEQKNDPELDPLFKLVLPTVEPDNIPVVYYVRNGVLI